MIGIQVRQSKTSVLFIVRKAVIPKALFMILMLAAGGLYLAHLPLTEVAIERMEAQTPLAVWIRRANELKLDYEQVKRDPKNSIGKPVLWKIIVTGEGKAFYDGDFNSPLRLKGTFAVPRSYRGHGSHVVGVISEIGEEIELIALGLHNPLFLW